MKLFGLKDSRGKLVPNIYFKSKFEAKKARAAKTAETGNEHTVTFGPDHYRYKGDKHAT